MGVKETVLRVIRGEHPGPGGGTSHASRGELITSFKKLDHQINFNCNLNTLSDSLLEEDYNDDGAVVSVRLRFITNPAPTLNVSNYKLAKSVRVSCVVPVAWLFSAFSAMPSLQTVSFGTGCFEDDQYEWREQYTIKLEKSSQVRELKVEVNIGRFLLFDPESQRHVKNRVLAILDHVVDYFPKLVTADMVIPVDTSLKKFFDKFPDLKNRGILTMDYNLGRATYRTTKKYLIQKPVPVNTPEIPRRASTSAVSASASRVGQKQQRKKVKLESASSRTPETEPQFVDLVDDSDNEEVQIRNSAPSSTTERGRTRSGSSASNLNGDSYSRSRSPSLLDH